MRVKEEEEEEEEEGDGGIHTFILKNLELSPCVFS